MFEGKNCKKTATNKEEISALSLRQWFRIHDLLYSTDVASCELQTSKEKRNLHQNRLLRKLKRIDAKDKLLQKRYRIVGEALESVY